MAKEIKQKIVLDGEKEYSAALKEANRNLKTLKSELKAETAEMGRNASEAEKSRIKRQNLRKQIAEQEKVVKTYRQALQEVREKYADNEDEIAKWEVKLNDARAALGKMKTELEGVGDSFRKVEQDGATAVTATKSIADAIGRVSQVGDTVADTIAGIFTGMLGIVSSAVSDVWSVITETAARANSWTDIAGWWNTDPQKIQQWGRALGAAGKELNDMNNAVSKLAYGDHDKIRKLTGVSWAGDIDQWQYAADVLNSIASMDYTHKAKALEELFGEKRASKTMDIVNAWGDILKNLETFNGDKTGYGMTTEGLETMNELDLKLKQIDEKWTALKDRIAEPLGKVALGFSVNVEGVMDGVADFLNAKDEGEREAALGKIRANLEDFFTRLAQVVQECIDILREVGTELQNSDDPVTKAIGDILVGLTDALQWMIDNQQAVKGAFETIFGFWLLFRLAAVAGKLGSILVQIEAIKAFEGIKLSGAAAGGVAAERAATAAAWAEAGKLTTAGTAVPGWMQALGISALWKIAKEASENLGTGLYGEAVNKKKVVGVMELPEQEEEKPITHSGHGGSFGEEAEETEKKPETITKTSLKRRKNITGTATEEQMQGGVLEKVVEAAEEKKPEPTDSQIADPFEKAKQEMEKAFGKAEREIEEAFSNAGKAMEKEEQDLANEITDAVEGAFGDNRIADAVEGAFGDSRIADAVESAFGDSRIADAMESAFGDNRIAGAVESAFGNNEIADLLWAAAALISPSAAQKDNEETWKEEQDLAGEIADAVESAFGDSEIADLIRATAAAVGPKKNADGSYQKDFTGLFLNMNPTDQMDYILQGLGDVKKRGQLYADILRYGDPNNDNVAGWKPWSALLRYWGEYTDERGNRQDLPLDPFEVDELVRYIRDLYEKKAQAQLEKEKEEKQKRLEDAMRNGDFGPDAQRRIEEDDFNKALDEALGGSGKNSPSGGFAAGLLRFLNADQWLGGGGNSGGGTAQEGITRADLQNFNGLPAQLRQAAQEGTAKGVSGIRVYMDGVAVGRLVAPTVSQEIAKAIG